MSPESSVFRSSSVALMPSTFDFVGLELVDVLARVDVADLPDAVHLRAGGADLRQVVRLRRQERPVVAVRRALVVAGLAGERTCDDAADRVRPREDAARDLAGRVQLVERDRLLVRGDLEHRVGGGVDDPLARLLVLLAELLDDVRPRRGLVADHAPAGLVGELLDHLEREAVRVGRHRLGRDDAHELPVAGRRVLALGALEQPSRDGRRAGLRRAPFQVRDVSEAKRFQVGDIEPTDRTSDVSERIGAFVAVFRCVRQLSRPNRVEHNHAGARHGAAILVTA